MLSKEAVEAIQQSTATEKFTVDGVEYFTRNLHDPRQAQPQADTLKINTLTGVVDYLKTNIDKLPKESLMIHVKTHAKVNLLGALSGHFRQRETLVSAENEELFSNGFRFGNFYDAENFNIALQSLFVRTDAVDEILRIVGNIREEDVKTFSDNGVTQSVVAKTGIARVSEVEVPNPVILQPYRTFPEVEQPESLFVLRMKKNPNAMPSCALFEADGGKWKLEAIQSIKAFMADNTEGVVVIG